MRLGTKLAAFLVVLAAVLGGGVFAAVEVYKQQSVAQERSQVQTTANVTANRIEKDLREARASLSSTALRTETLDGLTVRSTLTGPSVVGVHIVAANGTVIVARGRTGIVGPGSVGADVGDRAYVREALESKTYVSDPVWLPDRGRYGVVLSAPVFINGSVAGVVATTRYIDARSVLDDERMDVYIQNTSRATSPPSSDAGDMPRALVAQARVETTGWTVAVRENTAPLQGRLDRLLLFQVAGVAGVLLFVCGFAVWQYRGVIAQIRALRQGFRALRDGDYDHRVSLSGSDEWRRITDSYAHLADELAAREQEIRENEERLQVLNRVLRHNIRNSMNTLIGRFEMIQAESSAPAVERHAESGVEEALSVTALSDKARQVESVLASAEDGLTTTDLAALVADVAPAVAADHPSADIETDLPETAPVRAVPELKPAVVDALDNACRHNDSDEPRVRVGVESGGETTTLSVVDNGGGFPTNERRVIEESTETPLEHGSGLGLWLITWTVEKSGGTVDISDRADGTRLELRFQRATEADA